MSSTIISAIPPPPPLVPAIGKLTFPISNMKNKINECLWATKFPDIQQGCYLSQICLLQSPKACKFKNVSSILQQGPTCGLTCISMLTDGVVSLKEILDLSKTYQYTINGEMFSAKNLCDILDKVIKTTKENNISCQLYEGPLNCAKVKNLIVNGAMVLVPYPFQYKILT